MRGVGSGGFFEAREIVDSSTGKPVDGRRTATEAATLSETAGYGLVVTKHALLEDLDEAQAEVIALIGRPWMVGEFADAKGWPVWDFVERTYRDRHPSGSAADVLATLPTITIGTRSYGLWWRSDGLSGLQLQPGERVGLSLVGLHHLWPLVGDAVGKIDGATVALDILSEAVKLEQDLDHDVDWVTVRKGQYDLRSQRFRSREGSPIELLGQTLLREFIPLASSTTNFNYVVDYGAGRLAPLREVSTIEDYVDAAGALADLQTFHRPSPSPIQLPAAVDYLGLVLDSDDRWTVPKPALQLASVADATALGQSPSTQAEFDRNVSVLWNILGHLQSPRAADHAYERRGWAPHTSGSLNNLDIWLADVLKIDAEVSESLATIRGLGRIRQGAQHGSGATHKKRDEALARFGLSWPLTDWAGAWMRVSDGCAASIYAIAQAVRRA